MTMQIQKDDAVDRVENTTAAVCVKRHSPCQKHSHHEIEMLNILEIVPESNLLVQDDQDSPRYVSDPKLCRIRLGGGIHSSGLCARNVPITSEILIILEMVPDSDLHVQDDRNMP